MKESQSARSSGRASPSSACGGAGGNAVNNMIASGLAGVEFIVANTDAQALAQLKADARSRWAPRSPTGSAPASSLTSAATRPTRAVDRDLGHLAGSHMVFITAGMGGGTGTGAAPVIARAVREEGVLTVGVVTKPFAVRRPAAHARRREAASRSCRIRRHADRHSEPRISSASPTRRRPSPRPSPWPTTCCARRVRHHRPHRQARPDQSRLRRRQDDHGGTWAKR